MRKEDVWILDKLTHQALLGESPRGWYVEPVLSEHHHLLLQQQVPSWDLAA